MIGFFDTVWQPITACKEGELVFLARLMLAADSRNCTLVNGSLELPLPAPVPVAVYGDVARSQGKVLLAGGWNPTGFFNLPSYAALHDWYCVRAGSAGTLTATVGAEQAQITVQAAQAETNRVQVLWREVGKTNNLPVLLLKLRFQGDKTQPFKIYPEDVGTYNIEWIDIEPTPDAKFIADVGELTTNRVGSPLEITVFAPNLAQQIDISTDAVVFSSTM